MADRQILGGYHSFRGNLMIDSIFITVSFRWKVPLKLLLPGVNHKGLEDIILDEVAEVKLHIAKKEGEALELSYKVQIHENSPEWMGFSGLEFI
jgi:hypothetical protein